MNFHRAGLEMERTNLRSYGVQDINCSCNSCKYEVAIGLYLILQLCFYVILAIFHATMLQSLRTEHVTMEQLVVSWH